MVRMGETLAARERGQTRPLEAPVVGYISIRTTIAAVIKAIIMTKSVSLKPF